MDLNSNYHSTKTPLSLGNKYKKWPVGMFCIIIVPKWSAY